MFVKIEPKTYNKLVEMLKNKEENYFYTVAKFSTITVPKFEGSERLYFFRGKEIKGKDVKAISQILNITVEQFNEEAEHIGDLRDIKSNEGIFISEESCEKYIEANRIEGVPELSLIEKSPDIKFLTEELDKILGIAESK